MAPACPGSASACTGWSHAFGSAGAHVHDVEARKLLPVFLFVNCTMLPRLAASPTDAGHSDEPHPALDVDDVHLWLQPPASNSMGGPGLRTAQGTAAAQKANCDALGTQPAL